MPLTEGATVFQQLNADSMAEPATKSIASEKEAELMDQDLDNEGQEKNDMDLDNEKEAPKKKTGVNTSDESKIFNLSRWRSLLSQTPKSVLFLNFLLVPLTPFLLPLASLSPSSPK